MGINFKVPIPHIQLENLLLKSRSQAGQDLFVIAMFNGKKNGSFLEFGANGPIADNNTYLLEKEFDYRGVSFDIENIEHDSNVKKTEWKNFYKNIKADHWPDVESIDQLPTEIQTECRDIHKYDVYIGYHPDLLPGEKNTWENTRKNTKFFLADVLNFDLSLLDSYYDYLQVDIAPEWSNFLALEKATSMIEFGVITFEHDIWRKTPESFKAKQNGHDLLLSLGYNLIADNVTVEPGKGQGNDNEPIYFEDWYVHPKYVNDSIIQSYKTIGAGKPKYFKEILFKGD